jgi:tRNA(Ile)-lysidine synthase
VPFQRTDKGKINYPKGISSVDRRFCRRVYDAMALPSFLVPCAQDVIVACSGGLDSTVLAHAFAMAKVLQPGDGDRKHLVYVNHHLRSDPETTLDIELVKYIGDTLEYNTVDCVDVDVKKGNVQAEAREARYAALTNLAESYKAGVILLGHHANDVAETKLWQFLTGRCVSGIDQDGAWATDTWHVKLYRPLLTFTKEDLVRYALVWHLVWSEDETNGTDKYARNRIRNELIPWIAKEINPGIVKMLAGI